MWNKKIKNRYFFLSYLVHMESQYLWKLNWEKEQFPKSFRWLNTGIYLILNNLLFCCRFLLYLKLFLLMGVTWTFEIVSWSIYQSNVIWYATDFINVLRGLCIFVLFCMKKKIIYLLKTKFSNHTNQPERKQNKRSISRTSIVTQSTNSLQLSQVKS